MQYKGYFGSVLFDPDEPTFHGKVEFIKALISFEGQDAKGIKKAFEESVNDYLAMCQADGIEPEKPV